MKKIFSVILLLLLLPQVAAGQTEQSTATDDQLISAEVLEVVSTETRTIIDDVTQSVQTLRLRLQSGERAGEVVQAENDYQPVTVGDDVFVANQVPGTGSDYSIVEIDRTTELLVLLGIFAAVVVVFGGWTGVRSLLSLTLSFGVILYVLLPLLLAGYPPILVSVLIAGIVLTVALYVTHGVSKKSSVALLSTLIAIAFTAVFAIFSINLLNMSGFVSDEVTFLNFSVTTDFDFSGLLLGGIIIGVLGVLDDIAITQVAVVGELKSLGKDRSVRELFWRGVRVGRDHVGALINTLVLAYAGAALPLLLFLTQSSERFAVLISQENIVAEIARTLAGSIGLILTVPIATLLAVWFITANDVAGHEGHVH